MKRSRLLPRSWRLGIVQMKMPGGWVTIRGRGLEIRGVDLSNDPPEPLNRRNANAISLKSGFKSGEGPRLFTAPTAYLTVERKAT